MKKLLSLIAVTTALFLGAFAVQAATVPITTSFYADSLQSGVTPSASAFTLVKGKDGQGNNLSGAYGFVLDQGSASQEIVFCTAVSGTSATGCIRGVDLTTGTTSVTALEQTHNRGASVQITTAPVVNIMANILRGVESIAQPIFYTNTLATSTIAQNRSNLVNWGLLQDTAFTGSGAVAATQNAVGYVQISSGAQAAASTPNNGATAYLALTSAIATSTWNKNTATNDVIVSSSTGRIDPNFIYPASTTWPGTNLASSTVLTNDGNGNLSWEFPSPTTIGVFASSSVSTNTTSASTTLYTLTIPANTLNATNKYMEMSMTYNIHNGDTCNFGISIGNGASTSTIAYGKGTGEGNGFISTRGVATSTATEIWNSLSVGTNNSNVFQALSGINNFAIYGGAFSAFSITSTSYVALSASTISGTGTCFIDGFEANVSTH